MVKKRKEKKMEEETALAVTATVPGPGLGRMGGERVQERHWGGGSECPQASRQAGGGQAQPSHAAHMQQGLGLPRVQPLLPPSGAKQQALGKGGRTK